MAMAANEIEALIKAALPDARITVEDLAGDGDHYAANVVSETFRGISRVKQQSLGLLMDTELSLQYAKDQGITVTDKQVQAYFDSHVQTPPPFGINRPTIGMDVLSPRKQLVLSYSLPKGTYVLLCFVADDETGMPHAFMGMHKVIKLG